MADYETKLVVGADASQAEAELEKLEKKRKELESGGPGGAPPTPGGDRDSRRQGEEFGRAAYRQIGKAVAGFAASQIASIAFTAARTPGGDNVNVNRAESAVGGALQYGTMGAMLGGPIGAIIGGMAGTLAGLARHEAELAKQIGENRVQRSASVYNANVSAAARASDAAFGELLRGHTSGERASMLEARREELRSGPGEWSIKNLEAEIRKREDRGEVSGREYESLAQNIAMQRQREAALTDQIIAARMDSRMAETVKADDFADAYSRRGLSIGGDAATAAMNEQLAIGREQVQLLRRIADMGGGGSDIYSTRNIERAAATFK